MNIDAIQDNVSTTGSTAMAIMTAMIIQMNVTVVSTINSVNISILDITVMAILIVMIIQINVTVVLLTQ